MALDTLKSYLKDLKYPGISFMSNEEIADIFGRANRLYFLAWFMQKWDPDIELPSDERNKTEMFINVLRDNGFCSYRDSVKFVQDILELSPEEQVLIFKRMLHNLQILTSEEATSSPCEINYVEEIERFSKLDINLFPSLGPLKTLNSNERVQKLQECEEEILKLKEELKQLNNDCRFGSSTNKYKTGLGVDDVDIDLRCEIPALISNCSGILNETILEEDKILFSEDFDNVTDKCVTNMSDILKFCENKKFISEFTVQKDEVNNLKKEDDVIFEGVESLVKLAEEILDIN